ncbi:MULTISPECIES: WhiB family transcriptional regulator [Mycobacterium]|uniref:4Fe-4S Wbl-type domain-containing protein n=2 Tax=Mycobacterium TaxID=1763 RepID=A0ABP8RCF4_9MYCO|nr:WhiB family transcriptional regulator [Mycobacterium avium]QLK92842.1 WhiB family transcriptional regulator [Mycobacterium avium subsp. hominissuis]QWY63661.1 WhiB family transcriptional regulator [Mycobacterium avium subsp. hominissuis]QWY65055.1 WhiB family transcriptional regulator [Mycobacterium avium subsp. hominissuis]
MTPSPPPRATPLACQRDPERWFTRRHRTAALAGCLSCPLRSWCAARALACRATHGMWAGIWIDEHHDDAAPLLRVIAADDADTVLADPQPPRAALSDRPAAPLHRPAAPTPSGSLPVVVLARSSGHCEVLTEHCRYTLDRCLRRTLGASVHETASAAEVFGACTVCADIVAGLDPHVGERLGYHVSPGRDPGSVPFHWRGARWVLLARDGWLTELGDDAQTA